MTSGRSQSGFFAHLKQHHIYQVAAAYGAAIAVLIPIVADAFPYFGWEGAVSAIIIVLIAGLPVTVVLAWLVIKPANHGRRVVWQRKHWILGAIVTPLVIAAVVVSATYAFRSVAQRAARITSEQSAPQSAAHPLKPSFNPPADTLVVLPFTNLGGDPKQQYFSDGITEELTNALGQSTGLKVIAWDTASHYRDSTQPATAIGKALDVTNVLTGKILRQGNTVRVIVELVDARSGYQVWADHYDDSLANVFKVQDQISAAIAGALKVKFASLGKARTVNPQAHDLVLQANALIEKARTATPIEQARALYEQAIALAPDYADAHAGLAAAWFDLTQVSTLSLNDALPKVRAESNRALVLDPHNVRALVELAVADMVEGKRTEAKANFERALAIDPSNAYAHLDYGNSLPLQQSLAQQQEAVQLDPDNATGQNNLATVELDLGEYAQALAPSLAVLRLDPTSADSVLELALNYSLLHRNADAVRTFDLAQPKTELAKALVAAGRLTYQSVLDPKLHAQALAAVEALRRRPNLDPASMADVIQLYLALGQNRTALDLMPQNCAALPVGCDDLSVNPEYLPLRGDPRFQALVKQYDTVSKPAAAASAGVSASAGASP